MTEWASLLGAGLDPAAVANIVDRALAEDLGGSHVSDDVDVTSAATIPADLVGTADVRTRAAGVIAGIDVAALVFERAGAEVERHLHGGVFAFAAAPDADHEERRNQRQFMKEVHYEYR